MHKLRQKRLEVLVHSKLRKMLKMINHNGASQPIEILKRYWYFLALSFSVRCGRRCDLFFSVEKTSDVFSRKLLTGTLILNSVKEATCILPSE